MNEFRVRSPGSDAELESIANLIQDVFRDDATTAAHRSLVSSATFVPECLPAVWNAGGDAISVVQAVPCQIALLGQWIPGGIITMVATALEERGRGYMRACMQAAHHWLLSTGRPLAILYGVPAIYPRFGYRPVMPRSEVRYARPSFKGEVRTRVTVAADLAAIADIFNQQEVTRPCSIRRLAEPWIWTAPVPRSSLRSLEMDGRIEGYLRYAENDAGTADLVILEAASRPGGEIPLVDAFYSLAAERGNDQIVLRLMPDHPAVREATRRVVNLDHEGVQIQEQPPQAGMLCVLDGEALLERLRVPIEKRLGERSLRIRSGASLETTFGHGAGTTITLPSPADLAHLLSGYPGVPALHQWGRVHGGADAIETAGMVFPREWPRWTAAPYWGE